MGVGEGAGGGRGRGCMEVDGGMEEKWQAGGVCGRQAGGGRKNAFPPSDTCSTVKQNAVRQQ